MSSPFTTTPNTDKLLETSAAYSQKSPKMYAYMYGHTHSHKVCSTIDGGST